MQHHDQTCLGTDRRSFLQNGALILAAAAMNQSSLIAEERQPVVKFGLVTDLHYADKATGGTRHYRETLNKLAEAAAQFERDKPQFLVELGDFIDAASSVEVEQNYLRTINRDFSAISRDRHYILGNHCVDTLKKEEFLGEVEQEKSFYSFDRGGVHFVVLDSCFRGDGEPYGRRNFTWTDANVPAAELEWLEADLKASSRQVVVFAHKRLDVSNSHGVKNNGDVRKVLESSGKVLAVFQWHSHQNALKTIGGIHYCTMVAMVEGAGPQNNGYSLVEIDAHGTIEIKGFRNQETYQWEQQR